METCEIEYMVGHRDSVNSLSACGEMIASGCEDGTVRIWDLRIKKHCADSNFRESAMNVSLSENQVLASYGNKLVSYDLRGSVIINSASSTFYYSSDDINQISAHSNYLALPDDSGLISILSTLTPSPVCTNTLAGHTEVKFTQICTSAAFLDDQLLMSVGFDLQIIVWDYIRNIEVKRFNIGANYVNPPYPYSIAYKDSRVAIATGNGNVIFYDTEQLSLVRAKQPLRVLEAHRASVCHAHWANYAENLLITGSSDKCVCLISTGDVSRRIELDYKVKLMQPNWIETSSIKPEIFIATTDNKISILSFR